MGNLKDAWSKMEEWTKRAGQDITDWWNAKIGKNMSAAELDAADISSSEAQKSRDWNEEMYNKYESPDAIKRQYEQAGLNPALMYEGYQPSSVSSSSAQGTAGTGSMVGNPLMDLLAPILQMQNMKLQMDRTKADINYINKQAEGQGIDNANKQEAHDVNVEKLRSDIAKNASSINKDIQDIKESISRISVNDSTIRYQDSSIELQGTEKVLNMTKNTVEQLNAEKLEKLMPNIVEYQRAEINNMNALTDEAKEQANKAKEEALLAVARTAAENGLIDGKYYKYLADREGSLADIDENSADWIEFNTWYSNIDSIVSSILAPLGSWFLGRANVNIGASVGRNDIYSQGKPLNYVITGSPF